MFWVRTRDRECAELQEAEGKELHGSSTRTVQVRHANPTFRTRVSCTDRAREKVVPHGSAARTVFVVLAQHESPGRACPRGVCADFQSCTGRAAQHGPCCSFGLHGSWKAFARGVSSLFSARGVQIGTGHARSAWVKLGFAWVVQFSFF